MDSLWGEEFKVEEKVKTKKIISKLKEKKEPTELSTEKLVKSKKISDEEKLTLVEDEVNRVLCKQKENVLTIFSRVELHNYIQEAINFGRIAVDTETNNSLDPITCKLMGLCLYYKGAKQVYVPCNHVDRKTNERLDSQLKESEIREELDFLVKAHDEGKVKIIFHNGKFDYQVIKETCKIDLPIDWDTMIASKLLNENEPSAGLKQLYIKYIDPDQEKYDIEHLFNKLPYAIVDPNLFALYSATDAMMTDRLYEWEMKQFEDPSLNRVYNVLTKVEIPLIPVVAKMELNGVTFDAEYSKRLSKKYNEKLNELDKEVDEEVLKLKPKVDAWRLTSDANQKVIKNGKEQKSKNEQLEEPLNLGSPTQLAILLYDVLKCKVVDTKKPRGTGEDILTKLSKDIPLCSLLLKRRELVKLIDSFVDSLPEKINIDGKIHAHFNQFGTVTGRFSSSEPNLQQIPSHNKEIRMLFRAAIDEKTEETSNDAFKLKNYEEVLTTNGWKKVKNIDLGDVLVGDQGEKCEVKKVTTQEDFVVIEVL